MLDCQHDQPEGADILMVKPGLAYLDTISLLRRGDLAAAGGRGPGRALCAAGRTEP
ncbi:MAG: hypothetical protein ACO3B3_11175 [Cyanobium sp.]